MAEITACTAVEAAMKEKGWGVLDLADKIGCDKARTDKILKGEGTQEELEKVMNKLGMSNPPSRNHGRHA